MRDLELEFEAELEDLMRVLAQSDLESEAEIFAPGASSQAQDIRAQQVIRSLIERGVRDENQLTDAAFFDRHPERQGRVLAPNESAAMREWSEIRDRLVRPLLATTPSAACNDVDLPQPKAGLSGVSAAKIQCPTHTDAQKILNSAVGNAVHMLDNTIAELTNARKAACQGKPLGWPLLNDITACWLQYKLGVCIEDRAVWTAGAFVSGSVAEVIRRLIRPRDLLAGNEILYVCKADCQSEDVVAWSPGLKDGKCIAGTPERTINLCPPFWSTSEAPFREQWIIHEAAHLTHCDEHRSPPFGVSIGEPYCLAEFVLATNGRPVNPGITKNCGFTPRCGAIPQDAMQRHCGEIIGSLPPDWKP